MDELERLVPEAELLDPVVRDPDVDLVRVEEDFDPLPDRLLPAREEVLPDDLVPDALAPDLFPVAEREPAALERVPVLPVLDAMFLLSDIKIVVFRDGEVEIVVLPVRQIETDHFMLPLLRKGERVADLPGDLLRSRAGITQLHPSCGRPPGRRRHRRGCRGCGGSPSVPSHP